MANEITKTKGADIQTNGTRGIRPKSLNEVWRMAGMMVDGGIAPKGMTIQGASAVMMFGMELGLSPIQSLRDICFINGRPTAYGDAVSGLVNNSGLLEDAPEVTYSGQPGTEARTCEVKIRRRGRKTPFCGRFSMADAKRAGLIGKDNWKAYPDRMLYWRAYSYAARDGFSDVLKGLTPREVAIDLAAEDYKVIDSKPVPTPPDAKAQPAAIEEPSPFDRGLEAELAAAETIPTPDPAADLLPGDAETAGAASIPEPEPAAPPRNGAPRQATLPGTGPAPAALWAKWCKNRQGLTPENLLQIKRQLGVEAITQATPAEKLEEAVILAGEILGR
jgi:hypothetical protein